MQLTANNKSDDRGPSHWGLFLLPQFLAFIVFSNSGCALFEAYKTPAHANLPEAIGEHREPLSDLAEAGLATNPGTEPKVEDDSPAVVRTGSYSLKNLMSGLCLAFPDSGQTDDPPIQERCRGSDSQIFVVKREGRGNSYTLRNKLSDKVLEVRARSASNGAQLWQTVDNQGDAQRFGFDRKASGQFTIRSLSSGKVLEATDNDEDEGVVIRQWDYEGHTHQVWALTEVGSITPLR
ncbi:MAG: RICIN domain-containing protein [Chitinophagaceae bacterium]|nr:RICIN domain-containing protein [Oligoflexus sp.]